jgi:hypothetical protein
MGCHQYTTASHATTLESNELVASFGTLSQLLKSWEKTGTYEVKATAAHGVENVAITRLSVPHSGSESYAFFSAHHSRLMLWPSS